MTALAAAGAAVGSAKGRPLHRRAGRAYTLAMLITGTTALLLAVLDLNAFLFAAGVFSLYLVFTGWRAAVIRSGQPGWLDHKWWTPEDPQGDFVAIGIWGQYIYVDPARAVVSVKTSADPAFDANDHQSIAVCRAIAAATEGG